MASEPLFDLTNATVVKNDTPVLHDLTLRIAVGEHTAILGPNGAGKTTLLNLLTYSERAVHRDGAPPPVRVLGRDRWDVFDLRSQVGLVTHDLHQLLVGGNSVGAIRAEDAVVSGFFATQGVLEYVEVAQEMRQRARDALARVGAAHLAPVRMDRMSTGEARRVLVARALVRQPIALILDEPTAGLDLASRADVLDMVREVAAAVTIVLVTHHVDEILPEIERVVLLQAGTIAGDGSKEEMLTAEPLSALFGAQVVVEYRDGYYYARGRRREAIARP